MKKNISIIGINYFPEDSSTGLYTSQMAEYLAKNAFNVDVLTGFPYYPQWKIWDSYKSKPTFLDENHGDIRIHRYRQYVPSNPTFIKRILHLLDFTCGSALNLFKIKKCDLVICIVPFTTSIVLGLVLAKMRGAKLWVHIQDFEFDAARDSGFARAYGISGKIFSALIKLEKWLLQRAHIVSTISYSMLEKLKTKTTTPEYFFPNWVDPEDINPQTAKPHPYLQSPKFKILYSGNIGAKQDWSFFYKIAEHFKSEPNIEFIVVGDGATKKDLLSQTRLLANVIHHCPIPFADLSSLLCSADLHILFQKGDIIDTVMPSKILGMMASAKPSLVTGNPASETAELFARSNAGYFVDSNNFYEAIEKITLLQEDTKLSKYMGTSARKYILEKFSKENILRNLLIKIDQEI